ncbi:hypothetical protein [Marinimicrobium sp. ABcell2]|uniref:hypothetical protein n=1 Tax=Marinimicrobium sp. ABcell2 TaxID=3069751 RepID=UPI0027B161C5|nr:hypothetical protein [Marinimicrobium sp. ABcell2]MDQ2077415.1 hypothetical protein [Marinimicrobium sp. ABcell2]
MKIIKVVGLCLATVLLTACGSSSSKEDPAVNNPGVDPTDPTNIGTSEPGEDSLSEEVTLPDGTVIERPRLEDIDPDNVPVEMEEEYDNWVFDTYNLRDPRGNVYEFVLIDEDGVESRQYLVFNFANDSYDSEVTGFALTDSGECYSRPTADSLNGPLHGAVLSPQEDNPDAFEMRLNLLDTYLADEDGDKNWQLQWIPGNNGLIHEIKLIDNDGNVVAEVTNEEPALVHSLEDAGVESTIRVPFEPAEDIYAEDVVNNLCPSEVVSPVVFGGFDVEYEGHEEGEVESLSFDYAAFMDLSIMANVFFHSPIDAEVDDSYAFVGFVEYEDEDGVCVSPEFVIELTHDYRSGGVFGENSWSGSLNTRAPIVFTLDDDGAISESSDPQVVLSSTDVTFDELTELLCD